MFEYELFYFFVGAPVWNLPVIIGSVVGFSRAKKGKSPVEPFLVGFFVFLIPVLGEYLRNKRLNTGYLFSEEVIIAMVFCAIYLCVMLPLAIRRLNKGKHDDEKNC